MMRHALHMPLIAATLLALVGSVALGAVSRQHEHPAGGEHRHPAAAKVKNPVAADAASIAAGNALYAKHCAGCHGDTGKGDGTMGDELNPKPANLTDADWKHGSSDGEIFTAVRNGIKGTGMKAFSRKMTAHQTWDVVNYLRSIGPAKSH
jgi:mono/diheme cytochrome c family protein